MNRRIFLATCASILFACAASAQSRSNSPWLGVWQAELDGQPSVTLTLADDAGSLGGTVVFNLIEKQDQGTPHIASIQPHVLLHPQADATSLSFEIVRPDRSLVPLQFTVALDGEDKARIHCMNCGADAAVAELIRAH